MPEPADRPPSLRDRFEGHEGRECGEHRTTGHRAWCADDSEWCTQAIPCRGCELPSIRQRAEEAERALAQARDAIADERRGRLAAEAAVRRALPAIESAHTALVTSSRDQGAARDTAWLYGIFVGWDPETPDETDGAMDEMAAQHRWRPEDVERLRELHNAVRALREALDAEQPKETP